MKSQNNEPRSFVKVAALAVISTTVFLIIMLFVNLSLPKFVGVDAMPVLNTMIMLVLYMAIVFGIHRTELPYTAYPVIGIKTRLGRLGRVALFGVVVSVVSSLFLRTFWMSLASSGSSWVCTWLGVLCGISATILLADTRLGGK